MRLWYLSAFTQKQVGVEHKWNDTQGFFPVAKRSYGANITFYETCLKLQDTKVQLHF